MSTKVVNQFIGLLLRNKDLAERWNSSNELPLSYFNPEYHFLLKAIKKYIENGFPLTRQNYIQEFKDLSTPREKAIEEELFNQCYASFQNKDNYPSILENIKKNSLNIALSDNLHSLGAAIKSDNKQEILKASERFTNIIVKIANGDNKEPSFSKYLEFPMSSMPTVLHPLINAGSASIICPQDYVAIPLLTALAGSIGRTYELEIKQGWRESTALWTVAVGKPGSAKSPALKAAIKPAYYTQSKYLAEHEQELKNYEKAVMLHKRDLKKWERNNLGEPPLEPKKPAMRRNIVADTTVEALAPIMQDNPRGLMLIRDELAGWITSMNQYKGGKGNDVQFFLECWGGGAVSIDRKSLNKPIVIPKTYLSVCGTCQPDTLKSLLLASRKDDGFAARLLPYYPQNIEGYWTDTCIDNSLYTPIAALFEKFSAFELKEDEWGKHNPTILNFSKCGKEEFIEVLKRHKELKQKCNMSGIVESSWAKSKGHIARLALIIHLIRYHTEETRNIQVDKESVLMAEQLGMYFLAHIEKIWTSTGASKEITTEEVPLVDKLKKWDKPITTRNLIGSHFAQNKEDAIAKLDELVKQGKGSWTSSEKEEFRLVA